MKIKDFVNSKKLFLETRKDFFKKGNLIKGEILETDDNTALIKIENIGMIKASSEQPLDSHKGKTLNFIIVDIFPDKIFLKPIFNDIEQNTTFFSENNKEEYLTNILKEFNIKPSPTSIDFLDNLIKFNLPINKNNLVSGIGVLDKLVHFINTKDDEMIILANNNKEIINVEKEDIRNFIVVKEDVDKLQMNFKDNINIVIKKSINNFSTNKIDNRLIKTIIFFLKYDIKPTLNNIKYFLELNENLTLFSKDFEKIKDIMDKKFTNQMKRIMIDIGSPKNQIEKNSSKYNKSLDKLIDFIKDYGSNANSKFNDNIEEIVNKIQFLKDMNKGLIFIYLPLNLDDNIKDTAITLLKKRKQKNSYKDKLNIFININTKNLGNIKVHCQVSSTYVDLKFNGINKIDLSLFKSNEDNLKSLVKTTGYEIRNIEYLSENNYTILDSLIINTNTIYNLDVQV